MEHDPQSAPRVLQYRYYYRWYAIAVAFGWLLTLGALTIFFTQPTPPKSYDEVLGLGVLAVLFPALYFYWLHPKLSRKVQVYADRLKFTQGERSWEVMFNDVVAVELPFRSVVRLRLRQGQSVWFSAALERMDYVWEGLARACPELTKGADAFEEIRLRLVQFDHHEKRKEWFFRHRLLDVFNWIVLPAVVIALGYQLQASSVVIHAKAAYFFRLAMYVALVTIAMAFFWSLLLKHFVFDKEVARQLQDEGSKLRDLAHESAVLQRGKFLQLVSCALLMTVIIRSDLNLFSVTKTKAAMRALKLPANRTLIVDNRYNCVDCTYALQEGDLVLFGKGVIGQVLAMPGDVVGHSRAADPGRAIASESIFAIPENSIAIKSGKDGKEVVIVPMAELVGKLKKP